MKIAIFAMGVDVKKEKNQQDVIHAGEAEKLEYLEVFFLCRKHVLLVMVLEK